MTTIFTGSMAYRDVRDLEQIAINALMAMPRDLKPSEAVMVVSIILKGMALSLKDCEA